MISGRTHWLIFALALGFALANVPATALPINGEFLASNTSDAPFIQIGFKVVRTPAQEAQCVQFCIKQAKKHKWSNYQFNHCYNPCYGNEPSCKTKAQCPGKSPYAK